MILFTTYITVLYIKYILKKTYDNRLQYSLCNRGRVNSLTRCLRRFDNDLRHLLFAQNGAYLERVTPDAEKV